MVGLDGEKMSKSRGNLVLVSDAARCQGVDPMAIRLALLARHHRDDWMWEDGQLTEAQQRLATWRAALSGNGGPVADQTVDDMRAALADDLDSPRALEAVDRWATPVADPRRRGPGRAGRARPGARRAARHPPLTLGRRGDQRRISLRCCPDDPVRLICS